MFVNPERAWFVAGAPPVLVLVGVDRAGALPVLAVRDGRPAACEGWRLLPRMTMCVVDGPGDAGFLVGALGAGDAWFDSVDRVGGAVVVAFDDAAPDGLDLPALAGRPGVRGGFVALAA